MNFPGCSIEELRGILYDRKVARAQLYLDQYMRTANPDGSFSVIEKNVLANENEMPNGSDLKAVLNNYISIGKIKGIAL